MTFLDIARCCVAALMSLGAKGCTAVQVASPPPDPIASGSTFTFARVPQTCFATRQTANSGTPRRRRNKTAENAAP